MSKFVSMLIESKRGDGKCAPVWFPEETCLDCAKELVSTMGSLDHSFTLDGFGTVWTFYWWVYL